MSGPERKRGAPRESRGVCPACGKKGLGNTYHAHGRGAYRQCVYCQEPAFINPGATPHLNEGNEE